MSNIDLSVFEAMPGLSALIKPDAPHYTVQSVTEDFRNLFPNNGGGVSKPFDSLFSIADLSANKEALFNSFDTVLKTKKAHQFTIAKDINKGEGSSQRHWLITNKPVFNDEGEIKFIIHSLIERDEILPGNDVRSAKVDRLNYLFTQAPVAICIVSGPNYIVELVNDRMLLFLGRDSAIIGRPIEETLTEAKIQGLIDILNHVQRTNEPYFVSVFPATILINNVRETRYFDLIFKPYYAHPADKQPSGIFCAAHNVTEQVLARQKLEEEKARTSLALSVGELGVIEIDWETRATKADKRCNDIFRFKKSGMWDDYVAVMHPEDQPIRLTAVEEGIRTGSFTYEVRLVFKDHSITWIRCKGLIYKNEEGKPTRSFGIVQDITEHKDFSEALQEKVDERTHELAKANEDLVRVNAELARSNGNLEEFAYAASHDLKEPIRKINFFSDNLKRELEPVLNQHQLRLFDRMDYAAKRMGTLIDDLLLYSHVSAEAYLEETVDLNEKIDLVLEDLELEIQEKKATITHDKLPTIKGHRRQWQQLFQNLIGNALKYSKPDILPQIHISCQLATSQELQNFATKQTDKTYYLLEIKDNGIGFDQEDADRIFNMFTRLHGNAEYKGTGVGLSIVRKVVENHKGHIWAQGKAGEGANFKIIIPAK